MNKAIILDYLKSFLEAMIIVFILFLFLWPVSISGISMEPGINDGDVLLMTRFYRKSNLQREDIIICKNKGDNDPKRVVKRIIGLPNETIEIENGDVYVDGEIILEDYIKGNTYNDLILQLNSDEYFILGDNREGSIDSRDYGAVKNKDIIGKVVFEILPLKDIKTY